MTDDRVRERYYRNLPISEIWGIGRRLVPRLNGVGIRTIDQFVKADPAQIRQIMTMTGVRLQAELRGVSCLELSEMADVRKGLACTRSFGRPITCYTNR
ncbi:DNA polymerase Y subunit UmuC family protein [Acetobacter senegalensis]|uniref:hypothetical protein n=1 Tax=Acetobacter senegalensis TaxID=446692 RepID=UPI001EDAD663|nr:hypothetical protein [Acetobacter senegalensis]